MRKIILRILLVIVILAVIGLYIYEMIANGVPPTQNLFRAGSIILLCVVAFLRTFQSKHKRSLEFYELQYSEILTGAFQTQPFWKKKLLCAVRLYNENNYNKALDYLMDLKKRAETYNDHYAVNLFVGLCFTDMELYEHAAIVYQQLIDSGNANSRIFSNLGHVQMKSGLYKKALRNYEVALEYDRDNAYAYNNIAQAHFQMYEFEEAIEFALKALEVNPKLDQASTLLAITYTLLGDRENSEKYFHIAINSGRDPKEIQEAIKYFITAQHAMDEDAAPERDEDK